MSHRSLDRCLVAALVVGMFLLPETFAGLADCERKCWDISEFGYKELEKDPLAFQSLEKADCIPCMDGSTNNTACVVRPNPGTSCDIVSLNDQTYYPWDSGTPRCSAIPQGDRVYIEAIPAGKKGKGITEMPRWKCTK